MLLLILLLLVGGYFLLGGFGGTSTVKAPYVDASAKVVAGAKGYTLVLDGAVKLPGKENYKIQSLTASLLINGVPVQSKNLVESPTDISGPSSYPISFSPSFAATAEGVFVKIEGNVAAGKTVYVLSSVIPVALPDKSALAKDPAVYVSLSSVRLLGPTKQATLVVTIYNPNDSKMRFGKLTLSYGKNSSDLALSDVPAKGSSSTTTTVSVPADAKSVSFTISGSYSVNGVSRTLSQKFDLNLPELRENPPVFSVKARAVSLGRKGYELNVFGSVKNPNAFNLTIQSLEFRVVKNFGEGNVVQSVSLLSNKDVLPEGSASFSKTVTVAPLLSNAVGEVVAKYNDKEHVVSIFPLPVIDPASFLDPVTVTLRLSADANSCAVVPVLSGPDYNVDVSLKISDGNTTKDYGSFVLKGSKTLDAFSTAPGDKALSVSGDYGIKSMGILFPLHFNVEVNCTT